MRVSDGVLDVVGNNRRSATLNAHFKSCDLLKTFSGFFATVEPILGVLG
jgi:hypothetical protein